MAALVRGDGESRRVGQPQAASSGCEAVRRIADAATHSPRAWEAAECSGASFTAETARRAGGKIEAEGPARVRGAGCAYPHRNRPAECLGGYVAGRVNRWPQ